MPSFQKPSNKWAWGRIAGWVILAGVLLWTLAAALLRGLGPVPWLAWTGYPTFSPLRGFELAVIPLLLALLAGWLEGQAVKDAAERSLHHAAVQANAAQQKAVLNRIYQAALAEIAAQHQAAPDASAQGRISLVEVIREALPELNPRSKGELLRFLYEQGLLSAANPPLALNGLDFSGVDLPEAHLPALHLEGVDLRQAKLEGAQLRHSRLSGADLRRAILRRANLQEVALVGANLTRANLERANLTGADLTGAELKNAYFKHASLKDCRISGFPAPETDSFGALDQAILIDTVIPDGRKVTNARGKEFLQKKEMEDVINRL